MINIRILTIGGSGMLGSSIMLSKREYDIWGTYLLLIPESTRMIRLDITNKKWIKKVINENKPDVIINVAAVTNVDECEEKPDYANEVHVIGSQNLIDIIKDLGLYYVYISTDSVFDGVKGNYIETDTHNPLNIYAKTKLEGEKITAEYQFSSIIRTNIYGYNWLPKYSIAEWILYTLRENKPINLFKDVYFNPTLVNNLTEVIFEFIEREITGLYHVACPESISKLDFGYELARVFGLDENLINPISAKDFNFRAPRPFIPTLNCSKAFKKLKTKIYDVKKGLTVFKELEKSEYLKRLKSIKRTDVY